MIIENLRGIWIPREVLLNEELTDKEKIILAIILYSSEKTISSFVSNKSISNLVNVTQERVSKIISSLKAKGYIEVKLNYKLETKEIENRQITPISEEEAKVKVKEGNFNVEDFEENFETKLDNLPTGVKHIFSLDEHEAKEWAYNEAMYGE